MNGRFRPSGVALFSVLGISIAASCLLAMGSENQTLVKMNTCLQDIAGRNGLAAVDSSERPVHCDDVLLYLDDTVSRSAKLGDAYLIVIARLGKGERSARLNRVRLSAIESYLRRKSKSKLVTAEGSRVEGLGRVEIYVGGQLMYTLRIVRNSKSFCPSPVG